MLQPFLKFGIQQLFRRTRFPGQQGDAAKENIREIAAVVEAGATAATELPSSKIFELAGDVPWDRREFFWEGVAFGQAVRCAFSRPKRIPHLWRISDGYRLMHYTGWGFWNGIARRRPLPEFSMSLEKWAEVDDFSKLGPLLAGGISFGVVCGAGALHLPTLENLKLPDLPGWREGTLHGCGRALWFLYTQNIPELQRIVGEHPNSSECLLEGIGIAIAFTQLASPGLIMGTIRKMRLEWQEALIRGAASALALTEDQAALREHLIPRLDAPLREAYEKLLRLAETERMSDSNWYIAFLGKIRSMKLVPPSESGHLVQNGRAAFHLDGG